MRRLLPALLAALLIPLAGCSRDEAAKAPVAAPAPPPPPALEPAVSYEVKSGLIDRNETIAGALGRMGIELQKANEIVAALDGIFDFRKSRPGDEIRVTKTQDGTLQLFEFRRGPVEEYLVRNEGGKLVGEARKFEIEKQVVRVTGTLDSSLYEALIDAGEDPQLAVNMADVLAFDIDFYNDPRKGDTFHLVVEKHLVDGKRISYGEILAAEYVGELTGSKKVFRYDNPRSGRVEYFSENGTAARRAFLKTPLKFARVTSGYGSRFHPVLKYVKRHEGVDYGAGVGTPVWAVGDGVITHAGWAGACGKMVSIRHFNGLDTVYCHFSRIAPGIRNGARVSQKQVIGYVGTTGRSTGPHLHYGVKRGGRYINPLSIKFPPSDPIPADQLPDFQVAIAPLRVALAGEAVASAEPKPAEPAAAAQAPAPAPAAQ